MLDRGPKFPSAVPDQTKRHRAGNTAAAIGHTGATENTVRPLRMTVYPMCIQRGGSLDLAHTKVFSHIRKLFRQNCRARTALQIKGMPPKN